MLRNHGLNSRLALTALTLMLILSGLGHSIRAQEPGPTPTITPTPGKTPDLAAIAARYPTLDGSTSTHPLQVTIACVILNVPCQWQSFPWQNDKRIMPPLDFTGPLAEKILQIQHTSTHDAYENLIAGNTDFILVARQPSPDEIKSAAEKKVNLDVRAVALDAFVFIVNKENALKSLTIDQLRDIYTGKITDWSEVGGRAGRIQPFQRDRNSGSQELMEGMVMKGAKMIDAPDMVIMTMIGAINAVDNTPEGLGYSVYYYAVFMLPSPNVRLIGVNGVVPTGDTLRNRSYPLTTEVYAVIRQGMPADSTAVMLRDWLFTRDGQMAVAKSGYIPIFDVK